MGLQDHDLAGIEALRQRHTIGRLKTMFQPFGIGDAIHQVSDRPSDDSNKEMAACLHGMEFSDTFLDPEQHLGLSR
ncbi:MAG: hypothetical protein ABJZ55_06205 [Fuerstiella sp.]